ncbi:MAG TPA: hypothetical protein VNR39_07975 [Pseudolabrys sp.]|nr:hypothetical protein [Pseudolabrys sp.]
MLRAAAFCLLAVLLLLEPASADGLKSFRVTHLERGRDHHIKDVAIDFEADAARGIIASSQVGITLCDQPGGERYKPHMTYKTGGGAASDTYNCASKSFDGKSSRTFTVTSSSTTTREGSTYRLRGKLVIQEKGVKDAEEAHSEEAVIALDGAACKLVSYERVNERPNLAASFASQRKPETIVTTSASTCEWR